MLEKQLQADDSLYEKYGKPLENHHTGEFVAIGKDGRIVLGPDDIEVLKKAITLFGSGNFVFRRVGFKALGKWRRA
jgi:hypothetical protein